MLTPGKRLVGSTYTVTFNAGSNQDTLIARVLSPTWAETTYTYGTDANLTRPSTGNYSLTITPDAGGRWYIRFEGTKTGTVTVQEYTMVVSTSPFEEAASRAYQ